jgi:hypothetical protein
MSISIVVGGRLNHYGKVREIASQLKKYLKKKPGSNCMADKRKIMEIRALKTYPVRGYRLNQDSDH